MTQIKITSTDQLINFIESTDLEFNVYLKICRVFTRSALGWFTDTERKEDLIQFLKTYKERIDNALEVPEFVDKDVLKDAKLGERYFYSNHYPKEYLKRNPKELN